MNMNSPIKKRSSVQEDKPESLNINTKPLTAKKQMLADSKKNPSYNSKGHIQQTSSSTVIKPIPLINLANQQMLKPETVAGKHL